MDISKCISFCWYTIIDITSGYEIRQFLEAHRLGTRSDAALLQSDRTELGRSLTEPGWKFCPSFPEPSEYVLQGSAVDGEPSGSRSTNGESMAKNGSSMAD